jgi:TfoX/Sxy family transcriptional regulator of competence genes
VDNNAGTNDSNILNDALSSTAITPVAPRLSSTPVTVSQQLCLAVSKSSCPYVTLQTEHGAMVIDRKKYLAALRGLQVLSATCSKSGNVRVLTVVHSSGTLKFYNQLDVDACNTNRRLRQWADKERRREAELQKACRWKAEATIQRKWIGERVTWVPRNEDRYNRIAGHVTELLVHPATGQKGCVITDDHGRQHRVWDRQGALYKPADAPVVGGEVRQLPAAPEAARAMAA